MAAAAAGRWAKEWLWLGFDFTQGMLSTQGPCDRQKKQWWGRSRPWVADLAKLARNKWLSFMLALRVMLSQSPVAAISQMRPSCCTGCSVYSLKWAQDRQIIIPVDLFVDLWWHQSSNLMWNISNKPVLHAWLKYNINEVLAHVFCFHFYPLVKWLPSHLVSFFLCVTFFSKYLK